MKIIIFLSFLINLFSWAFKKNDRTSKIKAWIGGRILNNWKNWGDF